MTLFNSSARILALAVLSLIAGCQPEKAADASQTGAKSANAKPGDSKAGGPPAMPATTVSARILRPQPFSAPLSVNGTLLANQEVELRAETSGRVESIGFAEGKPVKNGQVMVQIDDAEVRANLQRAQARHKLALAQEARIKQQLDAGAASSKDFDQAAAERSQSEADVALLKAQMDNTQVKAPFAGRAGLFSLYRGSFVQPGTRITTLQDLSRMKLEFSVPEQEAWRVRQGMTVHFLATGQSDTLMADIYALEPRLDANTRAMAVRAYVKGAVSLLPGAFAEVVLKGAGGDSALVVPPSALAMGGVGAMVFLAQEGKAVPRPVQVGGRTPEAVQLLSGVKAGDTVITSGFMALRPGSPVQLGQVE